MVILLDLVAKVYLFYIKMQRPDNRFLILFYMRPKPFRDKFFNENLIGLFLNALEMHEECAGFVRQGANIPFS